MTPRARAGAVAVLLLLGGCTGARPDTRTEPRSAGAAPDAPPSSVATAPVVAPTSSMPPATAPSVPPFIAQVQWVRGTGGRSLHVVPTAAGRVAQGPDDAAEAWTEVLRLAPDADQPGMRAQFDCHWVYARLVRPDKPSWNLEPWRPVVSASALVDARCNPGGSEAEEG